jgi:hypothetical protein
MYSSWQVFGSPLGDAVNVKASAEDGSGEEASHGEKIGCPVPSPAEQRRALSQANQASTGLRFKEYSLEVNQIIMEKE